MLVSKRVILIIMLSIYLLAPAIQFAHGQTPPVYEVSLDLRTYRVTKISFNFPYTNNVSIGEVSTVGHGVYNYSGSATFFSFIAQDVDNYAFQLRITYPYETVNETGSTNQTLVTRTIVVGLWSGTLPEDGYMYRAAVTEFIINVRLSVGLEPSYPTEEQVAAEVMNRIQQALVEQQEANRLLTEQISQVTLIASVLCVMAVVVSFVSLGLAGFVAVRRRRLEA